MAFRINHLHLKTPDPKKTADFYVEYTGAKIAKESTRPDGGKNYRLDLHGVELNITQFLDEQSSISSWASNMSPSIPITSTAK